MSTNTYPIFFQSTLLGTSTALFYSVPAAQTLQDLNIKLTNTSGSAATATVYGVGSEVEDASVHDGADNASVLTDTTMSWTTNEWIGYKIKNVTDVSEAIITANTATTITGTLAGGSENDWDIDDNYEIRHAPLALNEVVPTMSIPPNDYILVPLGRLDSEGEIHAKSGTADVVNIQAVGGKLHTE